MSDPKTQTVCHSLGVVTIIADSGIMIERPIRRPATKLLACRSLVRGFFMIRSNRSNNGSESQVSRCAAARMPAPAMPQGRAGKTGGATQATPLRSVCHRTDSARDPEVSYAIGVNMGHEI
jgi:hypothetical protein